MSHAYPAIHQFHPSCAVGDGVTNGLFYTRRLLRELGFVSEIFCQNIPPELTGEIRPLAELPTGADYLLLQHHSLGYLDADWLDRLAAPRVLVYHNITPAHLLPTEELRELSVYGREQLKAWAHACIGAIGDSDYNSEELRAAGYRHVITLPMLVDLDEHRGRGWDKATAERMRTTLNILFVGRINEHKRQHEIIEVFDELLHLLDQPARLVLAGGVTSGGYMERLRAMAAERGGDARILLTDKVPDAQLQAYYRTATLFVCLSEHEGFCMPVLEAMMHDVPVIAREAGALASTLGQGGLVLQASQRDPRAIAALMQTVIAEPGVRRQIIAGQRRNLERYAPAGLRQALGAYLSRLGHGPRVTPAGAGPAETGAYWQIEGPIDSHYSLAIVNRSLALALAARGHDVGLNRATGTGGGTDDSRWLQAHAPAAAALEARAAEYARAGRAPWASLRYHYPPWVDGMRGELRVMHSYGWEESGYPEVYVQAFNRGLDLVTTASTRVRKILRDAGVRIPVVAVGTGVDHVLDGDPEPLPLPTGADAGFRFLHVSSCFPRKGVDVLLAAYGKAFRAHDDVVLIIKTFPNPHNDAAEQLAAWRARDADYPRVEIIDAEVPQTQLLWLYRQCHAFVAPSRGEGFGMPMAEAMLLGVPVITTGWGGQTDFCTPQTAWLCDYDFAFAETHLGVPHSAWVEPRIDHLAELMREVRQATPEALARRTAAGRALCEREYTWASQAARNEAALLAVAGRPAWRREPRIGWVSTWNTRCGIANYSHFLCDGIPDDRLVVLAAQAREPVAEDQPYVVRCWAEDVDCQALADLEQEIAERGIEAMVIQYNFGFFSLKALGGLIRRLRARDIPSYVFLHSTADVAKEDRYISLSQAADELALAERLLVHGIEDMNRLKGFGLVDNVLLFPHGVLPTPEAPPRELRIRRGLDGKRIVATYGFLLPHKGAQPLIRAFSRLADLDASLHLLLVTALYPNPVSHEEKRACEALIAELDLADRVTLVTDFLPDAESLSWLQMADLIVYPYQFTQESSSAAVRGGLAAGRPVAVTPLRIFDDVAGAAHVLPGTDEAALAHGIWELMSDSQRLADVADRGRAWCDTRRWPSVAQRLVHLIDGVANDV